MGILFKRYCLFYIHSHYREIVYSVKYLFSKPASSQTLFGPKVCFKILWKSQFITSFSFNWQKSCRFFKTNWHPRCFKYIPHYKKIVPLLQGDPVQPASHPPAHWPVTRSQVSLSLQWPAHRWLQFTPYHVFLHSVRKKTNKTKRHQLFKVWNWNQAIVKYRYINHYLKLFMVVGVF